MSDLTTGREALLAELIGEVAVLLRHVDTVAPAINAACASTVQAAAALQQETETAQRRLANLSEAAKIAAVKHVARHVNQASERAVEIQSHAMRSIAHEVFRTELEGALQQVTRFLNDQAAFRASESQWWALAATALAAARISAALTVYVMTR
jgi:transposase